MKIFIILLIALFSFNSFAANGDGGQGEPEAYYQCLADANEANGDGGQGGKANGDGGQGGKADEGGSGGKANGDGGQGGKYALLVCSSTLMK